MYLPPFKERFGFCTPFDLFGGLYSTFSHDASGYD